MSEGHFQQFVELWKNFEAVIWLIKTERGNSTPLPYEISVEYWSDESLPVHVRTFDQMKAEIEAFLMIQWTRTSFQFF